MKRQTSYGFNKEKLVLLGTALLLSWSAYNFFASTPVPLEVTTPVTPLPVPAPLTPDKIDTRMANVEGYIRSGSATITNADGTMSQVAFNRDRKNPFEPIDDFVVAPQDPKLLTKGPANPAIIPPPPPAVVAPPPPPEPIAKKDEVDPNKFGPKDAEAQVKFEAVARMNGITYALLKDKDDKTMQVKVGDYLEEFKYTVTKIEKQAIWVTDDKDRVFVARDLSFTDDGSGGDTGEEEKPVKKKPLAKEAKPTPAAAPAAPKAAPPKQTNNNNNNNNNKNANDNGRNNGRRRGGNNNNNNNNNNNMNVINNTGY